MKAYKLFASLAMATALLSSCKKDDLIIPNEEELITTLNYTLVSQSTSDTVLLSFVDLDGPGGNDPVITGGTLTPNTMYDGTIEVLNEQTLPAEDITEEVIEEAEEHQFFFLNAGGLDLIPSYTDTDADGNPLGVTTTISTNSNSSGQLTVILRHEPNKSASGVPQGEITNAGGETDIEVVFDVDIQ